MSISVKFLRAIIAVVPKA